MEALLTMEYFFMKNILQKNKYGTHNKKMQELQ